MGPSGHADAPSVVLLHGAGANARIFDDVTGGLPGVEVHALSYPGRAGEPGPLLRDIDSLVDWTDARVAALGLMDVMLVGHSLGTAVAVGVAWRMLRRGTARVHSVMMLSTPTRPAAVHAVAGLWRSAVLRGEAAHVRAMGFLPNAPAHLVEQTQRIEGNTPADAILADWDVAVSIGDRRPPAMPVPLHFVSGALDRMGPEADLRAWAGALPCASVELWPGVGHRTDVTEAPRVAQKIRDLLRLA